MHKFALAKSTFTEPQQTRHGNIISRFRTIQAGCWKNDAKFSFGLEVLEVVVITMGNKKDKEKIKEYYVSKIYCDIPWLETPGRGLRLFTSVTTSPWPTGYSGYTGYTTSTNTWDCDDTLAELRATLH